MRINLDDMENVCDGSPEGERKVCVRMGALAALTEIERLMAADRGKRRAGGGRGLGLARTSSAGSIFKRDSFKQRGVPSGQ